MIKISLEEAKQDYYPRPAGMSVKYTDAFTLTPLEGPQYEKHTTAEFINYWIKRQRFEAQLSFNEGYIYVLENKGQPGILKIGYTDRTPQARVKEINSGTGVITPWFIVNAFPCKAPAQIESIIHSQIDRYRVNKEGFAIHPSTAEQIITHIIAENNAAL
jgi:hypothetical protein